MCSVRVNIRNHYAYMLVGPLSFAHLIISPIWSINLRLGRPLPTLPLTSTSLICFVTLSSLILSIYICRRPVIIVDLFSYILQYRTKQCRHCFLESELGFFL
ncbi:unnamed protein product [Parnassius mnemosyne]|uniref:Uncharacterized protein n=1 Tax=Parnassius mnemosyne TaxID=213953 RepID=A0AAV1L1T5_9NEOP